MILKMINTNISEESVPKSIYKISVTHIKYSYKFIYL